MKKLNGGGGGSRTRVRRFKTKASTCLVYSLNTASKSKE